MTVHQFYSFATIIVATYHYQLLPVHHPQLPPLSIITLSHHHTSHHSQSSSPTTITTTIINNYQQSTSYVTNIYLQPPQLAITDSTGYLQPPTNPVTGLPTKVQVGGNHLVFWPTSLTTRPHPWVHSHFYVPSMAIFAIPKIIRIWTSNYLIEDISVYVKFVYT